MSTYKNLYLHQPIDTGIQDRFVTEWGTSGKTADLWRYEDWLKMYFLENSQDTIWKRWETAAERNANG